MFDTKKAIKHSTNPNVCEYVFEKYLKTVDYRGTQKQISRHFDHLGIIDTLGWSEERTPNSFYYSCEDGCIFSILSCGLYLVYINFSIKEVYVFKENPFPIHNS